jgi:hypothetical protein
MVNQKSNQQKTIVPQKLLYTKMLQCEIYTAFFPGYKNILQVLILTFITGSVLSSLSLRYDR